MKLYKLTTGLGDYFVIATDPTEAEQKLSRLLNENNYGFLRDRTVTKFEVLAEGAEDNRFLTGKFLVT